MSHAGRKRDPIWNFYNEIPHAPGKTGSRARCKDCGTEMQGLVARMKDHRQKCEGPVVDSGDQTVERQPMDETVQQPEQSVPVPSTSAAARPINVLSSVKREASPARSWQDSSAKVRRVDQFIIKTTKSEKEIIDEQIARFIFATNSSFRLVEHAEIIKTVQLLRPGYTPPSRFDVAGKLLDSVYVKCLQTGEEILRDSTVCMSLDGWSNIHNEPVVCATVTTADSDIYLVDTIDTSGKPHTSEYLVEVAASAIQKCEQTFNCHVRSFVTDNAANVAKMRQELEQREDLDLVTYGCSAHLLNLLAKDLEITNIKEQVVQVVKYFRNNHFAVAAYKSAGGLRLIMPQDVRWNTMADCLETYITQWPKLMAICEQNRNNIDKDIANIVTNIGVKRSAEELLKRLKPIAVALDSIQKDSCTIADGVEIWKTLKADLALENRDAKKKFQKRYDQALSPSHFLANIVHPKYRGKNLTTDEYGTGMDLAAQQHAAVVPDLVNYKAEASPFKSFMFQQNVLDSVKPLDWWKSHADHLNQETVSVVHQLLTATASSAGVERVFSSFGLVHSNLRNRLGIEKAGKLVFLFKLMNKKPVAEEVEDEHLYCN